MSTPIYDSTDEGHVEHMVRFTVETFGGLGEVMVGWSGGIDATAIGSYARIDGPGVWIEIANEAGVGTNDFHPHSVWRDKTSDYGFSQTG
jgi:hypothetical protein